MNRQMSLSHDIAYGTAEAALFQSAIHPMAPVVSPVPSPELQSSHVASLAQMSGPIDPTPTPSAHNDMESGDGINDAPLSLLQMLQRPVASVRRVSPSPVYSDVVVQKPSFVTTPSAFLKEVQQPQTLTSFSASLSSLLAASHPGACQNDSISSPATSLTASSFSDSANFGSSSNGNGSSQQQRFKPFHEEKWSQRLDELRHFRQQHGHCLVPHAYPPNPQLACWVKRQRRQYKLMKAGSRASTMNPERIALLEEAGFVWDSHDAGWSEKLLELKQYRNKYGNCLVPSTYKKNSQLAIWVKCQRRQYKLWRDGKSSSMTEERRRQLDEVGFCWEARPAVSA